MTDFLVSLRLSQSQLSPQRPASSRFKQQIQLDFFGGTLSSGVGIPFLWGTVKADATYDRNHIRLSGAKEQSTSGLGDILLLPVMAGWTNGDFKFGGMFNIWAPTGSYEKGNLINNGMGYWTFEPTLAFSWLSSKIGTEVTLFGNIDFNTKNNTSDYQSGDILNLGGTVAQHLPLFGGFAGAGVSAFYTKQITGDNSQFSDRLGGFMETTYGIGPTISYVHRIGKTTLVVDGSWLPQTYSSNTTKGNYWWLKIALAF